MFSPSICWSGLITEDTTAGATVTVEAVTRSADQIAEAPRSSYVQPRRPAKMNGIDPLAWLTDILIRIAAHPELVPWCWQPDQYSPLKRSYRPRQQGPSHHHHLQSRADFGKDEVWVRDVANETEIADCTIWVYGLGEGGAKALSGTLASPNDGKVPIACPGVERRQSPCFRSVVVFVASREIISFTQWETNTRVVQPCGHAGVI